jgi:hypothetical protein
VYAEVLILTPVLLHQTCQPGSFHPKRHVREGKGERFMGERRCNGSENPITYRVAKAFGIAYGEAEPERGLEKLQALLGQAQSEEERQAVLGYGEVLQMRMMAGRGGRES